MSATLPSSSPEPASLSWPPGTAVNLTRFDAPLDPNAFEPGVVPPEQGAGGDEVQVERAVLDGPLVGPARVDGDVQPLLLGVRISDRRGARPVDAVTGARAE